MAQVTGLQQPVVASTGFTVLRPKTEIDSRYMYHLTRSDFFIDRVTAEQTGSHYPATSDRVVRDQVIPLPDLNTELASLIDDMERYRISASQHIADALGVVELFIQAVLGAACSGRLTSDWRDEHLTTTSCVPILGELSSTVTNLGTVVLDGSDSATLRFRSGHRRPIDHRNLQR